MKNDELIASLKEIIKPYVQDEAAFNNLTEESNFLDDLKINSANLVDVILDVEDKFDILIEDGEMENMLTVKGAIQMINSKVDKE